MNYFLKSIMLFVAKRITAFCFLILFIICCIYAKHSKASAIDVDFIVNNTFNIIKHHTEEGLRLCRYKDGNGFSIGYGTYNPERFTKKNVLHKKKLSNLQNMIFCKI